MCFTPWVSLTTAIIEFAVASFILIKYKDYLVPMFSAIFVYVLGFYQFSEFMLCTSGNPFLWATVGFVTYTFLPAIALHMSVRFTGEKFWNWIFYIIPVSIALFAFLKNEFILQASCSGVFVVARNVLSLGDNLIFSWIYWIYYFSFILISGIILFSHIKRKGWTKIYFYWIFGGFITVAMPIFLIVIFPAMNLHFPSIYCEFALGFTIVAVTTSELYSRKKKKEEF